MKPKYRALFLALFASQISVTIQAATIISSGIRTELSAVDEQFVLSRLESHARRCSIVESDSTDSTGIRLEIEDALGGQFQVVLHDPAISNYAYTLTRNNGSQQTFYGACPRSEILPVLAMMTEQLPQAAPVIPVTTPLLARQLRVGNGLIMFPDYPNLSSHEPNRLMTRMDANDISRLYMDFQLSLKHSLLPGLTDPVFDWAGLNSAARQARLYFAFNGRFSQYIGSRESSPVVSRRFNPELFLRIRNQTGSYWDFGYGHESNGQQIDNPEAFEQEFQSYVADNQPGIFARDGISRGWDYVSVDWEKQWPVDTLPILDGTTVTHFEYRRFLSNGLLQGKPEEYYQWEDGGDRDRPRQLYDGLNMSLQYLFSRRYCTSGENFCLEKLELNQTTGYRDILEHNTSTLELTTNILGLPLQLWAKSGYNSDLVDYYDYTNSWGIGLEFVSN